MKGRLPFQLGLIFINIFFCMAWYTTRSPYWNILQEHTRGPYLYRPFYTPWVSTPRTNNRHKKYNLITLKGGDGVTKGNVFVDDKPVCDDDWDEKDGTVVCSQLGFSFIKVTNKSEFGSVPDRFAMDDVDCSGDEDSLDQCRFKGNDNCYGDEGAGVICKQPMLVKLLGGNGYSKGNIMIDEKIVCKTSFDYGNRAAYLICGKLGFDLKQIMKYGSIFGHISGNFPMYKVDCISGVEDRLEECQFYEDPSCNAEQAGGVVCKIPLEITLRGGDDNTSGNVYINNQPVCNVDWFHWNENTGTVVCRQLGLYFKMVTHESNFGNVTTDFQESEFSCTGMEDTLDQCSYRFLSFRRECGPFNGAGVICVKSLEEKEPTILELMKAMVTNERFLLKGRGYSQYGNPTYWGNVLAYDTDRNKDGRVSWKEIEDKFKIYVQVVFEILDQDKNGFITENELRSLKINLNGCQFILNAALESYPLKIHILKYFKEAMFNLRDIFYPSVFNQEDPIEDYITIIEEVKNTVASFVPTVFNILDQNSDGYISLEDGIASIQSDHLKLKLMSLFDILADLFEDDMFNITTSYGFDENGDGKLNAKDLYPNLHHNGLLIHFLIQLSIKLDINQDGNIQRLEMEQFLTAFLTVIDSNKDELIAFDDIVDVYRSMNFTSVQVHAMEILVRKIKSFIIEVTEVMVKLIITEQDRNGDRKSDIEELMNARVPCGAPMKLLIPYFRTPSRCDKIKASRHFYIHINLWDRDQKDQMLIMGSSVLDSMCGKQPNHGACFSDVVKEISDDDILMLWRKSVMTTSTDLDDKEK